MKVIEITNNSHNVVPVPMADGTHVYLSPRGKMSGVQFGDIGGVRKFLSVKEDLTEVGSVPEVKRGRRTRVSINEQGRSS